MATPIKDDDRRTDENYMMRCLELARDAAAAGEVPVGAVVVVGGRIIAEGRNRTRERGSALAHAEMIALEAAMQAALEGADSQPASRPGGDPGPAAFGRLNGAVLYCSLEPCFMCAGALLHARVDRVVFATADPKFGACGSLAHLPSDPRLNHRCPVDAGILAEESAILMREFFQRLR
jgi:tRNA(adenine34) deaminase